MGTWYFIVCRYESCKSCWFWVSTITTGDRLLSSLDC